MTFFNDKNKKSKLKKKRVIKSGTVFSKKELSRIWTSDF